MAKRPVSVYMTFSLMGLFILMWLGFGSLVATHAHPALPDEPVGVAILAAGAFIIAGALLVLEYLLIKRYRLAYYLSLGLFLLMVVVTFLDDIGWIDIAFMSLCMVVVLLLVKDKKWYLLKRTASSP